MAQLPHIHSTAPTTKKGREGGGVYTKRAQCVPLSGRHRERICRHVRACVGEEEGRRSREVMCTTQCSTRTHAPKGGRELSVLVCVLFFLPAFTDCCSFRRPLDGKPFSRARHTVCVCACVCVYRLVLCGYEWLLRPLDVSQAQTHRYGREREVGLWAVNVR